MGEFDNFLFSRARFVATEWLTVRAVATLW